MPKPSLYRQLDAVQVEGPYMMDSPRVWNCSLLRYKGRLWLSYRYHLGPQHSSRCATAMVSLDRRTFQPLAASQHLNLPGRVGDEHFEDARLFMFRGEPHISFTEMNSYRPGVDYRCVMKYAKLKLVGSTWHVVKVFHPKFGWNDGHAREKNWIFFEHDDELFAIYKDGSVRQVIQLDGEKVVAVHESPAAIWPWGAIRGGTPPVPYGKDKMLAIFHSSLATEVAPHFVRYYGGAYLFDAKPPFAVTAISDRPLMTGSEEDGHGYDPRYSAGWKPFIPFPCGLVMENPANANDGWLVSLGVNDWQCAIGRIKTEQIKWLLPDGSDRPIRYFRTANGTRPIQYVGADGGMRWLKWETVAGAGRGVMAAPGYIATRDGRETELILDSPGTEEITAEEYRQVMKKSV